MNLKKRAVVNISVTILYQAVSLIIGLIIPKFYTETFGSVYNGLNQTVTQIMTFLNVLFYGISAASIQAMFKPISEGDDEKVSAIFTYTKFQYRKMGIMFIAVLLPIVIVFPFIIKDELPIYIIISFIVLRGIAAAVEHIFTAKFNILFQAQNYNFAIYIVNIGMLLFNTALHLVAIFDLKNIIAYQCVALLGALLRMVTLSILSKKMFPQINSHTDCSQVEVKQKKDVLVSEIAGLIIDSTDMLLLSSFCGLVYTSIYSVYNFVVVGLGSVISSIREGVFSGLGRTFYSDLNHFKKVFSKFETLYLALVFYLYSIAIVLYKPFIVVYTAKMDADYTSNIFPILFILMKLVVNLRIPSIIQINIAGHFKQVKKYAVTEAIINFCVSVALVWKFNIIGVAIGTIIGSIYRTPLLINYANKNIIKVSNIPYLKKVLIFAIPFLLSSVASFFVKFNVNTIFDWMICAIPVSIAVTITYALVFVVFYRDLTKSVLNAGLKMLKLKK